MPQTLLSVLALALAGMLILGQAQTSAGNVEAVVQDEFELAATGALLHAIEAADAKAFDEATTPAALKRLLGLPAVMDLVSIDTIDGADLLGIRVADLTPVSGFGKTPAGDPAACNPDVPLAAPLCNDLSDFHAAAWRTVGLDVGDAGVIPVEVRYQVTYVDAERPDVAVTSRRTFHKRVDVWARSPYLMRGNPNHQIHLRRVISFDPDVAAEYLRRSIRNVDTACIAERAALEEAAATTAQAATDAQRAADAARVAADAAQATATTRAAQAATAASQVTSAQTANTTAQNAATTARQTADALMATLLAHYHSEGITWRVIGLYQDYVAADAAADAAEARAEATRSALAAVTQASEAAQAASTAAAAAARAATAEAERTRLAATQASEAARAAARALAALTCS